jgi:hypothetical protein
MHGVDDGSDASCLFRWPLTFVVSEARWNDDDGSEGG